MHLLPVNPHHISPRHPRWGLDSDLIRVSVEHPIYVRPIMRVDGDARILAINDVSREQFFQDKNGRLYKDSVGGSGYASLDIFLGHGRLTCDPVYFFHDARTSSRIDYERQDDGRDMRLAHWNGMRGDEGYATHAHLVTSHLTKMPYGRQHIGDVIEYDYYIVDVLYLNDDGTRDVLAKGCDRFGTLKCPWVINANHLQAIEKHNPAFCIKSNKPPQFGIAKNL